MFCNESLFSGDAKTRRSLVANYVGDVGETNKRLHGFPECESGAAVCACLLLKSGKRLQSPSHFVDVLFSVGDNLILRYLAVLVLKCFRGMLLV